MRQVEVGGMHLVRIPARDLRGDNTQMDYEFSTDQELLRETVRRYLAEHAPVTPYVRAQLDSATGTSPEVWAALAEMGVTGLLVPERHGGAGMGMVDMAVVLEEMGRAVHPGPFPSSAVAAASLVTLVADGSEAEELLPGIASGTTVGTVAFPASTGPSVRAEGHRLTGEVRTVADGVAAEVLLVAASTDDGTGVFVVVPGADGVVVTETPTVDATRRQATIELLDTPARRLGRGDATNAVLEAHDRMIAGAVVDGVGAAEQVMTAAVDYAKQRRQFGKPIGSFQAVQHLCADMLQAVELGRAAAYYACWACDGAPVAERRRAVTLAAAYAGDGFYRVGASAIQVFGGIGFTWEHDAHLYYKRLLTLQQLGGAPHEHLEALAAIALG